MKKTFALIFLFFCWLTQELMAQETKLVHGKYVFEVSDNDDITLKDAKLKCIALAKAKAIKEEFGEMVTSDVINLMLKPMVNLPVQNTGRIPLQ